MFQVEERGIRLNGSDLYLDAHKKVSLSFISHAHADHVRKHHQIIATPATIALIKIRNRKVNAISLEYRQQYEIGDLILQLIPSGHILGAAQILVEKNGLKLVYTGDFKPGKRLTAESLEIEQADILIMESTFGSPQYIFPKQWQIIEKLVNFIENCFKNGVVPVVMGYATGKSQEILKILSDLDYQTSIHASIAPVVEIYEQFGVKFKNYQIYHGEDLRGRIFLIPPHLANSHAVLKVWQTKKIIASGWGIIPEAKYRYKSDETLPLSDHADYNELIEYVHQVQPQKVFITHGFDDFIHVLRKEGFPAEALKTSPQLSLF